MTNYKTITRIGYITTKTINWSKHIYLIVDPENRVAKYAMANADGTITGATECHDNTMPMVQLPWKLAETKAITDKNN